MPTKRLSMRRIRDLLRLKHAQKLSEREISAALGISKGAVSGYLSRARAAGLSWPLPPELDDDDALELLLFPGGVGSRRPGRVVPDWAHVDRELRRPGVTRALLWEEYRAAHPDGYGYAWFCGHYEAWKGRVRPTMRQTHLGGEKVFVDFAGDTIDVADPRSGEVRPAKLFVAAMGASSYIYAEACAGEGLEDWIGAHVNLFAFLGGVPKLVVPDNLKAAVTKADRYEPGLNRTYAEMAAHYGVAVLPARPRKPRDKAKVEAAVLVAQRWILARLRNRRFFSLAELNAAIRTLLAEINTRVMRGYGASRADLFTGLDRPHLGPLPETPYAFARWKRCKVAPDYHVEVDASYYSVPFGLIGEHVDVRVCARTVEVFHRGRRVASHALSPGLREHVTIPEHMPSAHRRFGEWTPARVIAAAETVGPSVAAFCEAVMTARPHPEQGFRTCLGVLALVKPYGARRVDAACRRAVHIQARSVSSVRSILKNGLDRGFLEETPDTPPVSHGNIRGQGYYH
ncbi:IS21 family transposase [Salinarimonas rosea]|uniref:IS21 family transposase n=1 Tax=Salinarimonas rosea TaxID=552063 RepID=UPI0003F53A08|nr:IS21 family transposase [Salinarimonas rosea]